MILRTFPVLPLSTCTDDRQGDGEYGDNHEVARNEVRTTSRVLRELSMKELISLLGCRGFYHRTTTYFYLEERVQVFISYNLQG